MPEVDFVYMIDEVFRRLDLRTTLLLNNRKILDVYKRQEPGLQATQEDDPDIYVRLYNDPKPELDRKSDV